MLSPLIEGAETCRRELLEDGPQMVSSIINYTLLIYALSGWKMDEWTLGYINYFRKIYVPMN